MPGFEMAGREAELIDVRMGTSQHRGYSQSASLLERGKPSSKNVANSCLAMHKR